MVVHLTARDVDFAALPWIPLEKLGAYELRMGGTFSGVSSLGYDFNQYFGVSFGEDELAS